MKIMQPPAVTKNSSSLVQLFSRQHCGTVQNVYKISKEVTILIVMHDGDGYYIRKSIDVNVIDREEDLFLCGLKTMRD